MIVVSAELQLDPDQADAFLAAAEPLIPEVLKEDGCLSYTLWRHATQPGTFHFFEEWESADALAAHAKSEHFRTFGRALRDMGVTKSEITRYEATKLG